MKTLSFFALIALTIGSTAAQLPNDYDCRDERNPDQGYSLPNNNYPDLNNLRIDELQREVYFKINRGIENGQLNRREAQYLSRAFGQIEQKNRYFRIDGFLSRQEEHELRDNLLTLNDQIRYQKHDNGRDQHNNFGGNRRNKYRRSW